MPRVPWPIGKDTGHNVIPPKLRARVTRDYACQEHLGIPQAFSAKLVSHRHDSRAGMLAGVAVRPSATILVTRLQAVGPPPTFLGLLRRTPGLENGNPVERFC